MLRRIFRLDSGRAGVISVLSLASTMGLQILSIPILLDAWGEDGFALFVALRGLASYVNLGDVGVQGYLTQRLAIFVGEGDLEAAARLAWSGVRVLGAFGFTAVLLTIVAFVAFGESLWRDLSNQAHEDSLACVLVFAFVSLTSMVGTSLGGWSAAVEAATSHQTRAQVMGLLRNVALTIVPIIMCRFQGPLWCLVVAAVPVAVMDIGRWAAARRLLPTATGKSLKEFLPLLKGSIPGTLQTAAGATQNGLQPAVLSSLSAVTLAVFAPARTVSNAAKQVGALVGSVVWVPLTQKLAAEKDRDRRNDYWDKIATLLFGSHVLGVSVAALAAPSVVPRWLPELAPVILAILPLMLAEQLLHALTTPGLYLLASQGRFGAIGGAQLVTGLAGAAAMYFVVGEYGPVGAAVASLVTTLLILVPTILWYERQLTTELFTGVRIGRRFSIGIGGFGLALLCPREWGLYVLGAVLLISVLWLGRLTYTRRDGDEIDE